MLDFPDQTVSNYVLPLADILICLYAGWRWGRKEAVPATDLPENIVGSVWLWLFRVVAPAVILLIIVDSTGIL